MKEGGAEKATLAGLLCQEEGHLQCYQEGSAAWSPVSEVWWPPRLC